MSKDNKSPGYGVFKCEECGALTTEKHICGSKKLCTPCAKKYSDKVGPKGDPAV